MNTIPEVGKLYTAILDPTPGAYKNVPLIWWNICRIPKAGNNLLQLVDEVGRLLPGDTFMCIKVLPEYSNQEVYELQIVTAACTGYIRINAACFERKWR